MIVNKFRPYFLRLLWSAAPYYYCAPRWAAGSVSPITAFIASSSSSSSFQVLYSTKSHEPPNDSNDRLLLYRLYYFDTRGAAEWTRYLLAIIQAPYADIRYPLQATAAGFGVASQFVNDKASGKFRVNMGRLPILQVFDCSNATTTSITAAAPTVIATLGQSHAMNYFLAERHGLLGHDLLERAQIWAIYESCRDIRSAYLQAKQNDDATRRQWLIESLPQQCQLLEESLPLLLPSSTATSNTNSQSPQYSNSDNATKVSSSPWLVGTQLSLADVVVYALLGVQTSIMTGATISTFDDAIATTIQNAYRVDSCPRLHACIQRVGSLPAVQEWEQRRPETFS